MIASARKQIADLGKLDQGRSINLRNTTICKPIMTSVAGGRLDNPIRAINLKCDILIIITKE